MYRRPRLLTLSALMVALLATLGLSGCEKNEGDALAAIKAQIAKNENAAADIELKNLVQRFPESGEGRYLRGIQLQKAGDGAAAMQEFKRALDLKFDANKVVPEMARSLQAQGRTMQLSDDFSNVTLTDADAAAELHTLVALANLSDNRLEAARRAVSRALNAVPKLESAQLLSARIDAADGKPEQALAAVEQVIKDNPKSDEAWSLKGQLLAATPGQQEQAVAAYRQSLAVKPDQVNARTAMIALNLLRGDFDAAEQDLALLVKLAPKDLNTRYYEGNLAYSRGKYPQAQALFQGVLRVVPNNPAALLSAAENELQLNSLVVAESMAAKALTASPASVGARRVLAQTYLRQGQSGKALTVLAPSLELPQVQPEVLALAAQAQVMNDNLPAAEAIYARLAKLKPTDPRLRTLLANAMLDKGNTEAAYNELQGISTDDKGVSADLAIFSARLKAGELDPALKAADTIAKKQPDRPLADHLRAQVFARKKDAAGTRRAFEAALAKDTSYLPAVVGLAALDLIDKKPEASKQRYDDLLKKQPNNAQALVALAEWSARAGHPAAEVSGYLDRAVKADPTDSLAWRVLIDEKLSRGVHAAALTAAQNAVAALPNDPELLDRLGQAQARMGIYDQALNSFGKLASQQPRSVAGNLGQAQTHLAAGNLPDAWRAVSRVLDKEPQNLAAQAVAVTIALRQKQYKPAIDLARTVQSQRKGFALGYVMEGAVEMSQSHWDAAEVVLRKALDLKAPGDAPMKLHQTLTQAGKPEKAEAMASAWLKAQPADQVFMGYLADSARRQSQPELAEQRYREILAQRPNDAAALNNLAMMLAQQKKPEAIALAEQALKAAPDQPMLLDTLAQALAANNQLPRALEVQKQALSLLPTDPTLRLGLVRLQIRSGEKDAAQADLTRLVASGSRLNAEDRAEASRLQQELKTR